MVDDLDGIDLPAVLAAWAAVSDLPVTIAGADAGRRLLYVNAAFEAASGYPSEQLMGRDIASLQPAEAVEGGPPGMHDAIQRRQPYHARMRKQRADGSTWWSELHVVSVGDDTGTPTHVVGVQIDVTDRVALEDDIAHAATHDGMTGLVNRAHFLDQLDREIARAHRDRTGLAVLFLDVDDLKATNDTHGHAAGDALLTEVAVRIRARLRGADVAGRYGGDEFVVLLTGLPADAGAAAAGAATVVDELRRTLLEPVQVEGPQLRVAVSIGISVYPGDATTAAALISHADAAMYQHKRPR